MINLLKKYKSLTLITILMNLLLSVFSVGAAFLLENILNAATTQDWDLFRRMLMVVPAYLLLTGIITVLGGLFTRKLTVKVIQRMRKDLHSGILARDPEAYQSTNTAEYISALSNDIKTVEENALVPFLQSIQYVFVFVATVAVLLYYSPVIAGIMFLCLLVMYLVPALLGKAISFRQGLLSKSFAMFTVGLKDQLSGYDVIRSFQLSTRTRNDFKNANDDLTEKQYTVGKLTSISEGAAQTLAAGTQLLIMMISAYMVLQGHMTAGVLLALLQLSGGFVQPVGIIMQNMAKIQGTKPVLECIQEMSQQQPSAFSGVKPAEFASQIRFEDVSFSYQKDQPVLGHVNLSFEKNKKYAIIGASGSGKSTLVKLMSANYGGYTGQITMDNHEIRTVKLDELLSMISVIHQNIYMFDETIEDNIGLHRPYSKDKWERALSASGTGGFLKQMADGIHTSVGENGINVSGGQRQRIAVARALIQEKPILVLDEGTSAVDSQTAYEIETALLGIPDITMITITHNLSPELLGKYDEIIYMEEGRIAGAGDFETLMKENAQFADFLHVTKKEVALCQTN